MASAADRLTTRLRAATRTLHAQAERTGIMQPLLRGQLGRQDYARLLRSLHEIYSALETASPTPLWDARLARTAALAEDLQRLAGEQWITLPAAAAARSYARRLHGISAQPHRLLAHAYVRYLGDLAGGRLLRQIVARSLGGQALAFYEFGGTAREVELERGLRRLLDAPQLHAPLQQQLIDEACWAFGAHVALFEELLPSAQRPSV